MSPHNLCLRFVQEKTTPVVQKFFEQTGDTVTCKCSSGDMLTTPSECNCSLRLSMLLPCRHRFTVRKKLGLPLYAELLYEARLGRMLYHAQQYLFLEETTSNLKANPRWQVFASVSVRQAHSWTSFQKKLEQYLKCVWNIADLTKTWEQGLDFEVVTWNQGIVRCRATARVSLWWPALSQDIKTCVRRCSTCKVHRPVANKHLHYTPLP